MASFARLEPFERPAVVMDCGTGFTKMGFAGNLEVCPAFHCSKQIMRVKQISETSQERALELFFSTSPGTSKFMVKPAFLLYRLVQLMAWAPCIAAHICRAHSSVLWRGQAAVSDSISLERGC